MSPEYLASILEIIIVFDFLCDIGCGHPVPVSLFLLLQPSDRFHQRLDLICT